MMSSLFNFQLSNFLLKFERYKNQKNSLGDTESSFHNF